LNALIVELNARFPKAVQQATFRHLARGTQRQEFESTPTTMSISTILSLTGEVDRFTSLEDAIRQIKSAPQHRK
jgi:hypothetical protein